MRGREEPRELKVQDAAEVANVQLGVLRRALTAIHQPDGLGRLANELRDGAVDVIEAAGAWVEAVRDSDPILAWSLLFALDSAEVAAIALFEREALRPVEADESEESCHSWSQVVELVGVELTRFRGHLVSADLG